MTASEWAHRRRRGKALDDRIVALGYKVGSRHVAACSVYAGGACTCREIAAGRAERKRRQHLRLYR